VVVDVVVVVDDDVDVADVVADFDSVAVDDFAGAAVVDVAALAVVWVS